MAPFIEVFLAHTFAGVVEKIILFFVKKFNDFNIGSEQEKSYRHCLYVAIEKTYTFYSTKLNERNQEKLNDLISDFLTSEEVQEVLAELLRGDKLNKEKIEHMVRLSSINPDEIPGLNFISFIESFENDFLIEAEKQKSLQGIIMTAQSMEQTKELRRQTDILTGIDKNLGFQFNN